MKKVFAFLLALAATCANAATLNPIQLLNPAGSTSGQAIVSTGASTAPAWGNVTAAALAAQAANTVVANVTASSASPTAVAIPSCSTANSALKYTSGTGLSCVTNVALLSANTFTGAQTVAMSTPLLVMNDTSAANYGDVRYMNNGTLVWALRGNSAGAWTVNRYTAGSLVDSPISVSTSTGAVTMTDGITASPISGSTGSFTTLAASGLITPSTTSGVKGTTAADSANAGSVGEVITASVVSGSAVSLTNNTAANVTSITLTAGDWDVWGQVVLTPSTSLVQVAAWVNTVTAAQPTYSSPAAAGTLLISTFTSASPQVIQTGIARINVSTSTTVYLGTQDTFGGTCTAYGYITARRRR